MDMMPPQAPPALTQSAYDEAAKAFDRLVALQTWLAAEQAGMPALSDTVAEGGLSAYMDDMEAYWNAPPAEGGDEASRRAALTARIADASRDLAELALHDGALDASAATTIRALVSASAAGMPAPTTVRELMFGDTPYAGVLLVKNGQDPEKILAFSAERGWEAFSSLVDVHAEMERRARRALGRTADLPGLARQHAARIGPQAFVSSREITGDPFATLVDRFVDMQRDKLRQAWFEFVLAGGGEARVPALVDAVFDASRLERILDVADALATRQASLLEAFNEQRLARVPANVAAAWNEAAEGYLALLRSLADADIAASLELPEGLAGYASRMLDERLRALGVARKAADIRVRIDRGSDPAARLESLQALFEGPAPAYIRLLDLAYQNIAAFDPVRLTATTSEGDAIAGLDDATLRRLVRELDLSTRYQAYVDTSFRSGEYAAARRVQAMDTQRAHMRLQAAEARLSYYLTGEPRSFRPDRNERGYQWVKAVLDAPAAAGRGRVEGHDILVRQMTYLGTPLRDILAIGVRQPGSVPGIVLYTPDAPDGVTFREFDDRAEAGRRFFYNPVFREYLLDRLPAAYARPLANGSTREFAGDRLANWVLGSSSAAGYTRTRAPFEEREVSDDFLAAAYEVDVQLALRNAQAYTRSAEQANWGWIMDVAHGATSHRVLEGIVEGVVTAPARAAQAAWRLYDNVKDGDNAQAFVDFADFYTASLSVAPSYAPGVTARGIVGASFRSAGRIVQARPPASAAVVFESRFAAEGVRNTGRANREGIIELGGKPHIEHNGRLYAVRYDMDYATWRLTRPDASHTFRGPAIQRVGNGTWTYRQVGLRGGSCRGPGASQPRHIDLYDDLVNELEQLIPDPLERHHVLTRMHIEKIEGLPSTTISPVQRTFWEEALHRAQLRWDARNAPSTSAAPTIWYDYDNVLRTEAPTELWHYGKLPYKKSDLRLTHEPASKQQIMVDVEGQLIGPELHGVRFTTLRPDAPIEDIRLAMGEPDLLRMQTYALRIDPQDLYGPQRRMWLGLSNDPAELLRVEQLPPHVFVARTNSAQASAIQRPPLRFVEGQFKLLRGLPPPAAP